MYLPFQLLFTGCTPACASILNAATEDDDFMAPCGSAFHPRHPLLLFAGATYELTLGAAGGAFRCGSRCSGVTGAASAVH